MTDTLKPQLAETCTASLTAYSTNDNYWMSQKVDGIRIMVVISGSTSRPGRSGASSGKATFLNRRGEPSSKHINSRLVEDMSKLNGDFVLDGELIGNTYWIFDLPLAGTMIDPSSPYSERRNTLDELFRLWQPEHCSLLPIARTQIDKLQLSLDVIAAGGEGLICNEINAPYLSGKRSRHMLKHKLVKQVDCVIIDKGREGKDNLTLALWDGKILKEIVDVSALTGDGPRCKIGDVVTINYLGWNGHRLTQPVRPCLRHDKAPEECTIDQVQLSGQEIIQTPSERISVDH